jgi:hypothetical protein
VVDPDALWLNDQVDERDLDAVAYERECEEVSVPVDVRVADCETDWVDVLVPETEREPMGVGVMVVERLVSDTVADDDGVSVCDPECDSDLLVLVSVLVEDSVNDLLEMLRVRESETLPETEIVGLVLLVVVVECLEWDREALTDTVIDVVRVRLLDREPVSEAVRVRVKESEPV